MRRWGLPLGRRAWALPRRAMAGREELWQVLERAAPPLPPFGAREPEAAGEARAAEFARFYGGLGPGAARAELLAGLARGFGADPARVAESSAQLLEARERRREPGALLQAQARLRYALLPRYRGLFRGLARIDGGLRFLVQLRADLLQAKAAGEADGPHVKVRGDVAGTGAGHHVKGQSQWG